MKTIDEILVKCTPSGGMFAFDVDTLLQFVPFEQAKPLLKDDATEEAWNNVYKPLTVKNVVAEMEEYMAFAWGKVKDHRALSAGRSVERMCAWLWLLDDTKTCEYAESEAHYENYGAPILLKICEIYGFAIPDGTAIRNMARGLPCAIGCGAGCAR